MDSRIFITRIPKTHKKYCDYCFHTTILRTTRQIQTQELAYLRIKSALVEH